jgi:hypothetical protein
MVMSYHQYGGQNGSSLIADRSFEQQCFDPLSKNLKIKIYKPVIFMGFKLGLSG